MHPAVRLSVLLVFAAVLPALPLVLNALIAGGLLLAQAVRGRAPGLRQLGSAVWRLRWLLAALAFVYAAFTEGIPLSDTVPGLTREGLAEGARRALILLNLVAAVQFLVLTTPLPRLLEGLLWLLRPLRALGLDTERLARRVGMVLEELPRLQQAPRSGGPIETVAALAADIEARARRDAVSP